ncbi:MAG: hypothetical protein ABH986_02820 [archaeon]
MKGQVSIEAIIAVIIAMVFFLLISISLINQQNSIRVVKTTVELKTECEHIAAIVSEMHASGKYIEWNGYSDYNISFLRQGFIKVTNDENESIECFASGKILDSSSKGNIKIYNYDGNVVIE